MNLKLQKFAPIDREHPIIEIVDEAGDVLFDLSRNDAGVLEMGFHPALSNRVLPYERVMELIEKAKVRVQEED